ncbi:MAG: iron-containing alcohol dehydrogenase, partial [Thiotrichaceae bacterium]|nr:iron-containing alcohol dehydrogenase [Thiotrichaceae bacterium]
ATGMDALTHAIEAYTCLQKNPMSDAYAVAAIKLVHENLFHVVKKGDDNDARFAMANASTLAGIAFSNSMVGAVHAIGHACGAIAHVHHGNAMAILLPYVMKFNMDMLESQYAELLLPVAGEKIFLETKAKNRAMKTVETILLMNHSLNKLCGMPVKLSDAGVKKEQFEHIAKTAMNDGAMLPNPKELNEKDIIGILKEAY